MNRGAIKIFAVVWMSSDSFLFMMRPAIHAMSPKSVSSIIDYLETDNYNWAILLLENMSYQGFFQTMGQAGY